MSGVVYRYPLPSLLLGLRCRFVEQGEPKYGTIVQAEPYVANHAEALVMLEDGTLRSVRVLKLQIVEEDRRIPAPYRGSVP